METGPNGNQRVKYNSAGKVQLVALARFLQKNGYQVWNLGHPPRGDQMKYKADMGGVVLPRDEFLRVWQPAVNQVTLPLIGTRLNAHDVIF
jgi:hypothetical protein